MLFKTKSLHAVMLSFALAVGLVAAGPALADEPSVIINVGYR